MIKNILIIVLALLLAASSYLLYENKSIKIVIDDIDGQESPEDTTGRDSSEYEEFYEKEVLGTVPQPMSI